MPWHAHCPGVPPFIGSSCYLHCLASQVVRWEASPETEDTWLRWYDCIPAHVLLALCAVSYVLLISPIPPCMLAPENSHSHSDISFLIS